MDGWDLEWSAEAWNFSRALIEIRERYEMDVYIYI